MDAKSIQTRKRFSLLPFYLIVLLQFFGLFYITNIFLRTASAETEDGQSQSSSVELNGDIVEYSVDRNKITAEGNVVIIHKGTTLMCDRVEFYRDTQIAYAEGNVRLKSKLGELEGDNLRINFGTMKGDFSDASIFSAPYYGTGQKISKVSEDKILLNRGSVTTCDLDKPHYKLVSRKIDIYPGDKLVARNVRMLIGRLPMLFIPKFTQSLKDKKPRVILTPGYDKEWGIFVLSKWRYYFNENFKGVIHVDAREKKDIAAGVDLDYKTPKFGSGVIRTYYMNERSITSKHFYQERPSPTIEKERFKAEWRHKWDIDQNSNAILQYYKLSDSTILKDYFRREYDEDTSPDTFFLFTRTFPTGTLSFRTDARVNRFESAVERLPELRYDLTSFQIGDTGLYLKNVSSYSNLTEKEASPSEVRQNTMRVDSDSELSYPMKLGIIELKPFVGGRNTYYSKTNDPEKYNSIRGIFKTGASLSTKFYKILDVETDLWRLDINRLRHIITPTISYEYFHEPTIAATQLDSFDGIDDLDNVHNINFAIENKLQTKRNKKTVELLRAVVSTDFRLKEHPSRGGFDLIRADIDFRPREWLTFYFDSQYDTQKDYLSTANFDLYINGGEKWSAGIGKRWNREVDDQITTEFKYKLNPKWALKTYTRFDLRNGILKEQEYTVSRDLHAWVMDINFNETRRQGNEIWIVFTLKAFPEMAIDFGTGFNKRKAGSQSSEGD